MNAARIAPGWGGNGRGGWGLSVGIYEATVQLIEDKSLYGWYVKAEPRYAQVSKGRAASLVEAQLQVEAAIDTLLEPYLEWHRDRAQRLEA